jgi:hypothetical protein
MGREQVIDEGYRAIAAVASTGSFTFDKFATAAYDAKPEMPHAPAETNAEPRTGAQDATPRADDSKAYASAETPPWVQALIAWGNAMEADLNERLRPLAEWLEAQQTSEAAPSLEEGTK